MESPESWRRPGEGAPGRAGGENGKFVYYCCTYCVLVCVSVSVSVQNFGKLGVETGGDIKRPAALMQAPGIACRLLHSEGPPVSAGCGYTFDESQE